jgi:hypothetical protein
VGKRKRHIKLQKFPAFNTRKRGGNFLFDFHIIPSQGPQGSFFSLDLVLQSPTSPWVSLVLPQLEPKTPLGIELPGQPALAFLLLS